MTGFLLALELLAATVPAGGPRAPDLSAPTPAQADPWTSSPSPEERRRAREVRGRNHAVGGAGLVLGAAYLSFVAANLHASLTCEDWDLFNPECEATVANRRAIFRGTVVGLAIVPPLLAARGVTRADPSVSALRAFWRALPLNLAGVAVAAFAPDAARSEPMAGLVLLGAGATLGLYLAPRAAAGAPPRSPPPAALALPVRDPALLR
jgi:hypothetical protein